jgi:hypothetical protein
MNGFREIGVAEMRQVEGGWGFLKKAWRGVKKAARKTWRVLKKPYVGIPVAVGLGALGFLFGGSRPPSGPNGPYQPPGLYPR